MSKYYIKEIGKCYGYITDIYGNKKVIELNFENFEECSVTQEQIAYQKLKRYFRRNNSCKEIILELGDKYETKRCN